MPEVTAQQFIVLTFGDEKIELTSEQAKKLRDELNAMFPVPTVFTGGSLGVTIREPVIPNWQHPLPQHQDRQKWPGSPPEIFCSSQQGGSLNG